MTQMFPLLPGWGASDDLHMVAMHEKPHPTLSLYKVPK